MTKPSNVTMLTGRLVADPEVHNGTVASMRLAVDWSGSNQVNPDQKTGFFSVKYFLTNESNPNVKFVKSQIEAGNFKKGTPVSIVGELRQETYQSEKMEKPASNIVVIADSIDYTLSNKPEADGSSAVVNVPDEF